MSHDTALPTPRSRRGLDGLNFFLADVRDGVGPFLGIYLLTRFDWSAGQIGMAMSANKINGIRAAVVSDTFSARATRLHNDANVLCLGERVVGAGLATDILQAWLDAEYEGGRHQARIDKMMALEG